ncbi:DUF6276 family protein [Halostagnicola bangensis]
MRCCTCGSSTVSFAVPESYRKFSPSEAPAAAICSQCLTVDALEKDDGTDSRTVSRETTDFTSVSDAFPTRAEPAAGIALVIGLCSSLARNRTALEELLTDLERTGTDPLLTLERVCKDPSVEPAIDLERRLHQLEQLV